MEKDRLLINKTKQQKGKQMLEDELKTYEAECENCGFSCFIQHNLNEEDYIIQICPICASQDFHTDDE